MSSAYPKTVASSGSSSLSTPSDMTFHNDGVMSHMHLIAPLHNRAPKIEVNALTSVSALLVHVKDDCKVYALILCGEC
ncbi:hypothetical protein TSAR_010207 [Trichomalopsis sarcophagae]|uniref:Uncharacterized protein n=1 Tax=Trichomalopsis sarcophagae TaxID=543379 RepID=A0A232FN28_9HYME|nr:hypothetical protein TSAR_010207 [Trichomalopsis sarcophagae]